MNPQVLKWWIIGYVGFLVLMFTLMLISEFSKSYRFQKCIESSKTTVEDCKAVAK